MNYSLLLTSFVVLVSASASPATKNVKLDLYYESLCPFCHEFIIDQLGPTYKVLGQIIDLTLIPYGNAKTIEVNGTYTFKCQHGPYECIGNKLHACFLADYGDIGWAKQLDFLICTLKDQEFLKNGKTCAKKLGLDYNRFKDCFEGGKGDELSAEMGRKTQEEKNRHHLHYVPWIVINDEHDEDTQRKCQANLKSVICEKYGGPKPPTCHALPSIDRDREFG